MRAMLASIALVALVLGARPAAGNDNDDDFDEDDYARYAPPFTPAWAAPQLHIQPAGGPPGTYVLITGAEFDRDVQVFYGDRPMGIVEIDDDRVLAVVPPGGGDDFVYVIGPTGRARSTVPFAMQRGRYDRYRGYERYDRYDGYDRFHPPGDERGWPRGWERPHDVPWRAPPPPERHPRW